MEGDTRIAWMKRVLYNALDLEGDELFENLLARDGEKVKKELKTLLDESSSAEYPQAVIFYGKKHEVVEMVEVVEGMSHIA